MKRVTREVVAVRANETTFTLVVAGQVLTDDEAAALADLIDADIVEPYEGDRPPASIKDFAAEVESIVEAENTEYEPTKTRTAKTASPREEKKD